MAKLPLPPPAAELGRIRPEVRFLPGGTLLWRVYRRGGGHPAAWRDLRHFGPVVTARFDHHLPPPSTQERGILYAAESAITCLAEVFQETRVVDTGHGDPWLVAFETTRPLRLLDVAGAFATRAGASMALHTGRRDRARAWSRALYAAYPTIEGLRGASAIHGGQPTIVLCERGAGALPARPSFHRRLTDPELTPFIDEAAEVIGYDVDG